MDVFMLPVRWFASAMNALSNAWNKLKLVSKKQPPSPPVIAPVPVAPPVDRVVTGRLLEHFKELWPAEKRLLKNCASAKPTVIADRLPEHPTANNRVRASFLRFLILGGDSKTRVHEQGVLLSGAWIEGVLNLQSVTLAGNVKLQHCRFSDKILLAQARAPGVIDFSHSTLCGVYARQLSIQGVVCFDHCVSTESINLQDSRIGGSLLFRGSQLNGVDQKGSALIVDRAVIEGSVRLQSKFIAKGEVRLCGAHIHHQLICSDSQFHAHNRKSLNATAARIHGGMMLSPGFVSSGTVRLDGTQVEGGINLAGACLDGRGNPSLWGKGLRVRDELRLTKLTRPLEKVVLNDAQVGVLQDDAQTWGKAISINGFVYAQLSSGRPMTAKDRIQWLDQQNQADLGKAGAHGSNSYFKKQPWEQIQKVFEETGRAEEARQMGMELERRLHRAGLAGQSALGPHPGLVHWLYGTLLGFGYRPFRLILFFFVIWIVFAGGYWYAAAKGAVFAPTDPLVFQHDDYITCRPDHAQAWIKRFPSVPEPTPQLPEGAGNWYTCEALRSEYSGFSPLGYSLDILLPLIDLQQEKAWGPMTPTPLSNLDQELKNFSLGHKTRLLIWIETLIGWGVSLVLVGMASGLIRKKNDH